MNLSHYVLVAALLETDQSDDLVIFKNILITN